MGQGTRVSSCGLGRNRGCMDWGVGDGVGECGWVRGLWTRQDAVGVWERGDVLRSQGSAATSFLDLGAGRGKGGEKWGEKRMR